MKKIAFVIRLSANQASYRTQSFKSRNNSHLIHLYRKNKTSHFRPRYFLETYYDTSISSFFHILFFIKIYTINLLPYMEQFFSFISFYIYVYSHSFYFDFGGQHRIKRLNKQTQRKDGGRKAPAITCSPLAWLASSISVKRSTESDSPRSPNLTSIGAWFNQNLGHPWNFARSEIQEKDRGEGEKGIYDKNSHYWIFANSIEKETHVNERIRLRAAIKLSKGIF